VTAAEVVQGLWVEGPLSAMEELSVRSFLAHGHEYHLYSYDQALTIPAGAKLLPAAQVLPADQVFRYTAGGGEGSYAAFANLFRYKLLCERGGWWADMDMICLRPLDFAAEHVLASERCRDGSSTITNGILRAPAGSGICAECYLLARQHEQRATVWGATGPALLREVAERHAATRFVQPPTTFCPIDWWRAEALIEPGQVPSGAYTVHLWQEIWRWNGWPKEPCRSPATLYQRLHELYP
jgi:hypothetical protein